MAFPLGTLSNSVGNWLLGSLQNQSSTSNTSNLGLGILTGGTPTSTTTANPYIGGANTYNPYANQIGTALASHTHTVGQQTLTAYPTLCLGDRIIFHFNNEMLMTIHNDGRIEKGPGFTTNDEASLKFWDVVFEQFPVAWWKGLVKRR